MSNPDLSGVAYPNAIGSVLFEQVRERNGGLADVQIKPIPPLTLDLSGFLSHMKATNYNRNFIGWPSQHKRDAVWVAQGPKWSADPFNVANLPRWNGTTYPGDYASGLGGGNFPKNVWQIDPAVLQAWGDTYSNRDPLEREYCST